MNLRTLFSSIAIAVVFTAPSLFSAEEGTIRFGAGLTYVHGLFEVFDFAMDSFEDQGYDAEGEFVIPAGLSLFFGYRFSFGGEILADIGPTSLVYINANSYDTNLYDSDADYKNWDVPVGLTLGYCFFSDKCVSPFLRAGARYHFTGGDSDPESTAGPYVGGGVNILLYEDMELQFEIGYDATEIEYTNPVTNEADDIMPGGLLASIRVAF